MKFFTTLLLFFLSLHAQSQNWTEIGPTQYPFLSGWIQGSGRIEEFKFHPTIANKIYAATLHGGLYCSNNNGDNWNTLGTDQLSACSISSFCLDPTNDQIIYLSTYDERVLGANTVIYKTTDGGVTWNNANGTLLNTYASSMIVDSLNHLHVVISTNAGIWKTTNGGMSWNVVKSGGHFRHMMQIPASNILIAVTETQVWRSTDFGTNWTQNISTSFAEANADGMRVCVNTISPNIVYVFSNGGLGTMFKSTDSGQTFTRIYNSTTTCLVCYYPNTTTGQGDYDLAACCAPDDPNHLYVAAHCIWESTDGGLSWEQKTTADVPIHTDHTQLAFDPFNTSSLWISNDGGMFKRIGLNDSTWEMKCNGLGTLEIYHACCSQQNKHLISFGTQDNGQNLRDSLGWRNIFGGDQTGRCYMDYTTNNNLCFPDAGTRMSCTPFNGLVSINSPFGLSSRNRLAFTPHNPDRALIAKDALYVSSNFSTTTPTWTLLRSSNTNISEITFSASDPDVAYQLTDSAIFRVSGLSTAPVITRLLNPAIPYYSAAICTIKNDPNVIYASFTDKIYRSSDQGVNWTDISYNLPNGEIKTILSDDYSTDETVYILSGDAYTDTKIFKKTINDSAWIDITGNLPRVTYITELMMFNDSSDDSRLYVALFGRGVWSMKLRDSLSTSITNVKDEPLAIRLYPNPATNVVTVENPEAKNYLLSIFTTDGKLLLEKSSSATQLKLDTKPLATGLNYYIIVADGKARRGSLIVTR
jgi:photosystem II stability/assembly factor-like uncharacterized protein